MNEDIVRLECTIRGRVQMVMFRDFVARKARKFGIVGRVQNQDDGSVSIIAEGRGPDMEALMSFVRKGPMLARVDSIEIHYRKPTGEFSDFKLIV